jgi:hypothetical protein
VLTTVDGGHGLLGFGKGLLGALHRALRAGHDAVNFGGCLGDVVGGGLDAREGSLQVIHVLVVQNAAPDSLQRLFEFVERGSQLLHVFIPLAGQFVDVGLLGAAHRRIMRDDLLGILGVEMGRVEAGGQANHDRFVAQQAGAADHEKGAARQVDVFADLQFDGDHPDLARDGPGGIGHDADARAGELDIGIFDDAAGVGEFHREGVEVGEPLPYPAKLDRHDGDHRQPEKDK